MICYFCLNIYWSLWVCVLPIFLGGMIVLLVLWISFTSFNLFLFRCADGGYFSGERQAWKKAKALVSQRASDRTKRKGAESVEKDFAEADEDANRVFDMEDCHNWIGFW